MVFWRLSFQIANQLEQTSTGGIFRRQRDRVNMHPPQLVRIFKRRRLTRHHFETVKLHSHDVRELEHEVALLTAWTPKSIEPSKMASDEDSYSIVGNHELKRAWLPVFYYKQQRYLQQQLTSSNNVISVVCLWLHCRHSNVDKRNERVGVHVVKNIVPHIITQGLSYLLTMLPRVKPFLTDAHAIWRIIIKTSSATTTKLRVCEGVLASSSKRKGVISIFDSAGISCRLIEKNIAAYSYNLFLYNDEAYYSIFLEKLYL